MNGIMQVSRCKKLFLFYICINDLILSFGKLGGNTSVCKYLTKKMGGRVMPVLDCSIEE